jgi:hypothetical protein
VLANTLLHATVYVFLHNLLNVLVHIANKMGITKKVSVQLSTETSSHTYSLLVSYAREAPRNIYRSPWKASVILGPILTLMELWHQILINLPVSKFNENPFGGFQAEHEDRRKVLGLICSPIEWAAASFLAAKPPKFEDELLLLSSAQGKNTWSGYSNPSQYHRGVVIKYKEGRFICLPFIFLVGGHAVA